MDKLVVDEGLELVSGNGVVWLYSDDGIDAHHIATLHTKEVESVYEWLGRWLLQRIVSAAALLLFFLGSASAATISLSWAPVIGATSYNLYQSVDQGVTWTPLATVAAPPWTGTVAEDSLILFKVCNKTVVAEICTNDRGAWYSYKLSLNPGSLSVK